MPRKIRCTVQAITNHGGQVYTLDLAPATPVPAFRPGQFLHLTVDDYDPSGFWPESRVFSIASSPQDRRRIRICYSVKGRYTTRMEQTLKVGGEVWIKLPYGEFMIDAAQEAVLTAGGTGISAFTAFIQALQPDQPTPVWLVYGARDPGLLLFREMILERFSQVPNFHLVLFTEVAPAAFLEEMVALQRAPLCMSGRISTDLLWPRLAQPQSKRFYLSGPPVMLANLREQLKTHGVAPDRILIDAWE